MTDDPLATARAWLPCTLTLDANNHPLCAAHGWDTRRCLDACAAALAAAVKAKGEADAELLRAWAARAPFVVKAAVDLHKELMMAHAADVPPPRTP